MNRSHPSFEDLLQYFPEVETPIEVTDELVMTADPINKVMPPEILHTYIYEWEGRAEVDEYTEFVPILKIKETDEYHALIYWRGGLMSYEYFLVTCDKSGTLITRKPIASTHSDGKTIKKAVATIDEDLIIHIMAGENPVDEKYNPENSRAFSMEILHTGDIIFSLGDD